MDRLGHLHGLDGWFRAGISRAFDLAYSIEEGAGSSPDWIAAMAHFEVTPISEEERAQVRAAQNPLRGAPVPEFREVVVTIVKQARSSLRKVKTFDAPTEVEILHTRLVRLFERSEGELTDAYRRAVLPARKGMFANVMAHQAEAPKNWMSPSAHALRCRHCGAPRLNEKDFVCAFCDQQMV